MPPFRDQSRVWGLSPNEERDLVDMYLEARGLRRNPRTGELEIVGEPSREKAEEALRQIRARLLEKRYPELEPAETPAEESPAPTEPPQSVFRTESREGQPLVPPPEPVQRYWEYRSRALPEAFRVSPPPAGRSVFWTEQREGKPLLPPTPVPVRGTRPGRTGASAALRRVRTNRILRSRP